MPSGVYKRKFAPWNKGIPRSQVVKDAVSKANKGRLKGSKNPNWGGGQRKNGVYILLYMPEHPFNKSRYVLRSRLTMEKHLGRYLTPEEVVHHRGIKYPLHSIRNKQDDRLENLQIFQNESKHQKFHFQLRKRNKFGQFT